MSFVGSNSFILNKSIVDNICLNNSKLEKQEIISLSLKLGFNEITKKIKKNIIVSGYGSNLSDGQKQQISILRALVSNKKILILDEAINSLDVALKQKLFKYLIHLKKNKIIVFVFHSNNLNKYADKIIKLK